MSYFAIDYKDSGTYISNRININVIFSFLRMRDEWLNQEISEDTLHRLHLLSLASSFLDPLAAFRPRFVDCQETTLASSFDQLIWFGDPFSVWSKQPWILCFGFVEDRFRGFVFREEQCG